MLESGLGGWGMLPEIILLGREFTELPVESLDIFTIASSVC